MIAYLCIVKCAKESTERIRRYKVIGDDDNGIVFVLLTFYSNFDEEFTREQPTLTPVHGQLSSRDQAEFQGFSWVSDSDRVEGGC